MEYLDSEAEKCEGAATTRFTADWALTHDSDKSPEALRDLRGGNRGKKMLLLCLCGLDGVSIHATHKHTHAQTPTEATKCPP